MLQLTSLEFRFVLPWTNPTCFKTEPGKCGRTFKFQPSLRKEKKCLVTIFTLSGHKTTGASVQMFNLLNYNSVASSSDVFPCVFTIKCARSRFSAAEIVLQGRNFPNWASRKLRALHLSLTLNKDFLCRLGSSCPHGLCPQFRGVPTHRFHGYE